MNEDERGITPANVTSMTLERDGALWRITVERGNGDSVQTLDLTLMEGAQLGMMLNGGNWAPLHVDFVDHTRPPCESGPFEHSGIGVCNKGSIHDGPCDYGTGI